MTVPIQKPEHWSSFTVVRKLRKLTGIKKVGHAGTLDPFATGLLILGFGKHTKQLDQFKNLDKEYLVKAKLGICTNTLDITGEVIGEVNVDNPLNINDISDVIKSFTGAIEQVPPMFSAKKVNGRRLYKYARQGEEIERKPTSVTIHSIEIVEYVHPELSLRVSCSAGTYIRTLVDDIGRLLGTGATAVSLVRTKIGTITLEDAFTIEEFEGEWTSLAV